MIRLKKLILSKLDYLFTNETNRFRKYSTCLYKVTSYINKGSQGKILKGFNRITRKDFAMKVIKKNEKTYIKNETKFYHCRINHKNIVKYKDVFHKNKKCLIVMEYLPQDLYYYLNQTNELLEKDVRLILTQIVNGLYFLSNKHNIYHADIKLENIGLANKNDLSSIKLIDFSNYLKIPKNKQYITIPKYDHGTLDYLAPELLIGKFYKNSDVWSIGVLLYLLLTNKFIQNEYLIMNINQNTIDRKLQKLKKLRNPITDEFFTLISLMLRVDPEERITLKQLKTHNNIYNNYRKK